MQEAYILLVVALPGPSCWTAENGQGERLQLQGRRRVPPLAWRWCAWFCGGLVLAVRDGISGACRDGLCEGSATCPR